MTTEQKVQNIADADLDQIVGGADVPKALEEFVRKGKNGKPCFDTESIKNSGKPKLFGVGLSHISVDVEEFGDFLASRAKSGVTAIGLKDSNDHYQWFQISELLKAYN